MSDATAFFSGQWPSGPFSILVRLDAEGRKVVPDGVVLRMATTARDDEILNGGPRYTEAEKVAAEARVAERYATLRPQWPSA